MLRCPRCNLDQPRGRKQNKNWSDTQWRIQDAVCIVQRTRFNCCRRCSPKYFKLYPDFIHYSGMRFNDADWMTLADTLTAAWSAEDWHLWYVSCNVPVPSGWQFDEDKTGERKTLLENLSYRGALRSRWPAANLDLQETCHLSQQKFFDPTNAVYAFLFRHVWPTADVPNSVVMLGDLVESLLGFWWMLEVSEIMPQPKYEDVRRFLSYLEFAVTCVWFWDKQGTLFECRPRNL